MEILIPILLIVGGLVAIFYIRPKTQNDVVEIKYLKTKKISELKDMFNQMDESGLGDDYREFIELKGKIKSQDLVKTPFSNKSVAYYEANVSEVTETVERYIDENGQAKTRRIRNESNISNEESSQEIAFIDDSTNEPIILEINGTGCRLDISKTFDKLEKKNNLGRYSYFNSHSLGMYSSQTIGFRLTEKTINENQNLYVIGEAYRVGDEIRIGKPQDSKKPFIVTTKTEEDLINKSKQNAMIALIGGIVAIVIGILMFIK